jgi:hypothetical protein
VGCVEPAGLVQQIGFYVHYTEMGRPVAQKPLAWDEPKASGMEPGVGMDGTAV